MKIIHSGVAALPVGGYYFSNIGKGGSCVVDINQIIRFTASTYINDDCNGGLIQKNW